MVAFSQFHRASEDWVLQPLTLLPSNHRCSPLIDFLTTTNSNKKASYQDLAVDKTLANNLVSKSSSHSFQVQYSTGRLPLQQPTKASTNWTTQLRAWRAEHHDHDHTFFCFCCTNPIPPTIKQKRHGTLANRKKLL
jgi:hypothetical protein